MAIRHRRSVAIPDPGNRTFRAENGAKSLSVNYVDAQRHLAEGDDGSGKMV